MNERQRNILYKYGYDMVKLLFMAGMLFLLFSSPDAHDGSMNRYEFALLVFSCVGGVVVTTGLTRHALILKKRQR